MRFNPKPKGRWKWPLIVGVPVAALLIVGVITNTNPPTNSAQTAPDAAPELRTRVYGKSVEAVTQTARTVAGTQTTWLRSWRVVPQGEISSGTPHHEIKVEVPVLIYTDDLTIHIDTDEKGRTRVNVESKSRVGKGDFGENQRHVVQFLTALDETLSGK